MADEKIDNQFVTGVVRIAWPHLFTPTKAPDSEKESYNCALLIKKTDTETIENLKRCREAAIKAKWGTAPSRLKSTIKDGDEYDDENFKGCLVVNVGSKYQPGVVDRRGQAVIDAAEVYGGCYVRVSIRSYAYDHPVGGKGISFGLNHVMKWEDGEPMGGFSTAEADFSDFIDASWSGGGSASSTDLEGLL